MYNQIKIHLSSVQCLVVDVRATRIRVELRDLGDHVGPQR